MERAGKEGTLIKEGGYRGAALWQGSGKGREGKEGRHWNKGRGGRGRGKRQWVERGGKEREGRNDNKGRGGRGRGRLAERR